MWEVLSTSPLSAFTPVTRFRVLDKDSKNIKVIWKKVWCKTTPTLITFPDHHTCTKYCLGFMNYNELKIFWNLWCNASFLEVIFLWAGDFKTNIKPINILFHPFLPHLCKCAPKWSFERHPSIESLMLSKASPHPKCGHSCPYEVMLMRHGNIEWNRENWWEHSRLVTWKRSPLLTRDGCLWVNDGHPRVMGTYVQEMTIYEKWVHATCHLQKVAATRCGCSWEVPVYMQGHI